MSISETICNPSLVFERKRVIHVKFGDLWDRFKKNWILSAIITGVIGLVLLLFPGSALLSVCYCIGGLMIAMGVIRVVRYFKLEHTHPYLFQSDLVVGLITIGLGLFMVTSPKAVMNLLPNIFGILLIGCGIGNILRSVDAKNAGFAQWGVLLGMAILSIVAGLVILSNPFETIELVVAVAGGCLIYESASDIVTTLIISRKLKTLKKNAAA